MTLKRKQLYNACQKCGDGENAEKYSILGRVPDNLTSGFHMRLCPECARQLKTFLHTFTQNWLKKEEVH